MPFPFAIILLLIFPPDPETENGYLIWSRVVFDSSTMWTGNDVQTIYPAAGGS